MIFKNIDHWPKSTTMLPQALSNAVKGSNDDKAVMEERSLLPTE
jgi:hypothetical protein